MFANSVNWGGFEWTGDFTSVDLIAASINALNGALLARRPDHYKQYTVVGIILMALLCGLAGGITRDVLVAQIPAALSNPAYVIVALVFGCVGYFLAYGPGQLFREGLFELVTSLALPWFAVVGAQRGVDVGLPVWGCLVLAVVTATAGRYIVDLTSGVTPKHFVRGEWYVVAAALSGAVWILAYSAGASSWWAMGAAVVAGFTLRVVAMFRAWEEPLAAGPKGVVDEGPHRPLLGRKIRGESRQELRYLHLDDGLDVGADEGPDDGRRG